MTDAREREEAMNETRIAGVDWIPPDATEEALEKAAQAWCTPATATITMDTNLALAFANILDSYLDALRIAEERERAALSDLARAQATAAEVVADLLRAEEERDAARAFAKAAVLDNHHTLGCECDYVGCAARRYALLAEVAPQGGFQCDRCGKRHYVGHCENPDPDDLPLRAMEVAPQPGGD